MCRCMDPAAGGWLEQPAYYLADTQPGAHVDQWYNKYHANLESFKVGISFPLQAGRRPLVSHVARKNLVQTDWWVTS